MPKEKVEINRKPTKPSNDQKVQKPKISSRAKTDEIKIKKPPTTRETSVDRNVKTKKTESISFRNTKTITNLNTAAAANSKTSLNKPKSDTVVASTSRKPIKATTSVTKVPSKGTKSTSRDVTSKRVTKEQFFPKKYPFSSYKHDEKPSEETKRQENKKLSRERTMTRVLSPSEVKIIQNIERPRTATIRKAEIVEKDEVKGRKDDVKVEKDDVKVEKDEVKMLGNDDVKSEKSSNDYESDFESYESDFEVYSSTSIETSATSSDEEIPEFNQKRLNSAGTDDERKLDSGNYELHDVKHKQILDNIKEAIEKENSNLSANNINSYASLSDEGFEDGSKYTTGGFVNFMDAKKKQQKKKFNLKSRKRGDDLMNMIRLNSMYYVLFDMEPISYEVFMQNYGKSGTIQSSCQTGDDDLHEEIQTDLVQMSDKSTQYPIRFSKQNEYFGEQIGKEPSSNKQLVKFMAYAGKLMLHVLGQNETKHVKMKENYSEIPFSDGYLGINYEKTPFLRNRNVVHMTFSKTGQLLSVHQSGQEVFMNEMEQLLARSSICLWDVFDLSLPQHILVSSGDVTRACFDTIHGNFIFGGICDGSISLWDLRESPQYHREIYDEHSDDNHLMRTATYTTIPVINSEPSCEKIIAVKSFHMQNEYSQNGIQICTCTESGIIVIWSLIEKHVTSELLSEDPGLTLWGSVVLVQGLVVELVKINPNLHELHCYEMEQDSNHIYVASNYGLLHCLISGMKPKPKLFSTENSTCVEMAPFSPTYFLSGCSDGIKLHSRFYEKPLMILRTEALKIDMIQWSKCRPCVFFIKDDRNNILIWDLMASDMFPVITIPFSENITDIKLSPVLKENDPCYMAIANIDGIRLHKINKNFARLTPEQYKTELNTFLNYANRL